MTQNKNESQVIKLEAGLYNTIPDNLGTDYIGKNIVFEPMSFANKSGHYAKIIAANVRLKSGAFMNAKMDVLNIFSDNNIYLEGAALMKTKMKSLLLLGENITLDGAALMYCSAADIYIKADRVTFENATFYNLPNLTTINVHAKKFQCKDKDLHLFNTPKLKNIWVNNQAFDNLAAAVTQQTR